jgi:hypothetical protein
MKKLYLLTGIMLMSVIILCTVNSVLANDPVKTSIHKFSGHDSTHRMMRGMKIQKIGDDSMIIYIMKKNFNHFSKHDFPGWHKEGGYYGHWAGFEIGIGGYVNSGFNMNFPETESYLNINTARSIMLNFNPFEFNLNIAGNHFGLTSGLGLQLNNYYFTGNYMILGDSSQLVAYKIVDNYGSSITPTVNKLLVAWINVPVLLEYQTNPGCRLSGFHIALGIVGGVRIGSYTKQSFHESGTTYYLEDMNDNVVASITPDNHIIRKHGPYHLNSFKADATVRIGWSFLNLFATWSITPMFVNNQGPVVYPWNVGITLLPW